MNFDENILIDMSSMDAEQIVNHLRDGYEPVPDDLQNAAKKKLRGRLSAIVSKTSGGKLSKWAAKRRKEIRNAKRAKVSEMVSNCNSYYRNLEKAKRTTETV